MSRKKKEAELQKRLVEEKERYIIKLKEINALYMVNGSLKEDVASLKEEVIGWKEKYLKMVEKNIALAERLVGEDNEK